MGNTNTTPNLEVQQYRDFPELPRKTELVTVVGRPDADGNLHGLAIMMGHGEPSPEADAELLAMAHLFKAAPHLYVALDCCKNRLETVLEAHPEIHLEDSIVLAYGALWDAVNAQRSWNDAIKISKVRGEWTPEMEAAWKDGLGVGPTRLPFFPRVDKPQVAPTVGDTSASPEPNSQGWGIVELMGHVRMAGRVSEETRFGTVMGRIDVPEPDGTSFKTTYFSGQSLYRFTPVTEEIARQAAAPYIRSPRVLPEPRPATPEDGDDFDNSDPFADE